MLSIPPQYQSSFRFLFDLSEEQQDQLLDVLRQTVTGKSPRDIAIQLGLKLGLELGKSERLVLALSSFYGLSEELSLDREKMVEELCEALIEGEALPENAELSRFKQIISEVLAMKKSFGMISRARTLATEFGKLFVECKIMTDFRPAFEDNIEERVKAGVIVHQLKVEYHHDGTRHSEVFLALDAQDLQDLKGVILRAEKKEVTLRTTLETAGVTLLSLDGLHPSS
jgi:hypothetical protein